MKMIEKLRLMDKIRKTNDQRLIAVELMKNGGNSKMSECRYCVDCMHLQKREIFVEIPWGSGIFKPSGKYHYRCEAVSDSRTMSEYLIDYQLCVDLTKYNPKE